MLVYQCCFLNCFQVTLVSHMTAVLLQFYALDLSAYLLPKQNSNYGSDFIWRPLCGKLWSDASIWNRIAWLEYYTFSLSFNSDQGLFYLLSTRYVWHPYKKKFSCSDGYSHLSVMMKKTKVEFIRDFLVFAGAETRTHSLQNCSLA